MIERFFGPIPVFSDESVGKFQKLSHEGRESGFWRFSCLCHALVFPPQIRVVSGGDEGGHVERIAQELSGTLYEGLAAPLAGLSGHGGGADKAGGLFAGHGADLGAFNQDRDGADLPQPGFLAENVIVRAS